MCVQAGRGRSRPVGCGLLELACLLELVPCFNKVVGKREVPFNRIVSLMRH